MLTLSTPFAACLSTPTIPAGTGLPGPSSPALFEGQIYLMLVDFVGYSLLITGFCLILYLLGLMALCRGNRPSDRAGKRCSSRQRRLRSQAGADAVTRPLQKPLSTLFCLIGTLLSFSGRAQAPPAGNFVVVEERFQPTEALGRVNIRSSLLVTAPADTLRLPVVMPSAARPIRTKLPPTPPWPVAEPVYESGFYTHSLYTGFPQRLSKPVPGKPWTRPVFWHGPDE